MKVLLINNYHYRRGGSEAVYFNTAQLLRENGHEVVFFSYLDKENIHTVSKEYFIRRGGKFSRLCDYFYNRNAALELDDVLSKEKPDIAHAHLLWGGVSASIFSVLKKHRIPLVHTAHDYRMVCPAYLLKDGDGHLCERCKGGHFYNCFLHRCSKGKTIESLLMSIEMYMRNCRWHPAAEMDGIIFVSHFSQNKHIEFDASFKNTKSVVLYNCPNQELSSTQNFAIDTFQSYYLFYGRLSEEKGLPTLIKAFENHPQTKLKIVGTGDIEGKLLSYCREKNISNVEFLGYKTGKELFDIVASAKFVCVPSECYENNPMTIVEAFSLGTPVIGADIGGISEVVSDCNNGFLFASGSVESLTLAIEKSKGLSHSEYGSMKKKSREFSINHFSREKHIDGLLRFYKELINANKR